MTHKTEYAYKCECGAYFVEPNSDNSCPICGQYTWEENEQYEGD